MNRRPNPKRYSLDIENVRANRSGDASLIFHDALKKMDGVIGFGSVVSILQVES